MASIRYRSSENFSKYAKRVDRRGPERSADGAELPTVQDADEGIVLGVTFYGVRVSAKKADVRVQVGGRRGIGCPSRTSRRSDARPSRVPQRLRPAPALPESRGSLARSGHPGFSSTGERA